MNANLCTLFGAGLAILSAALPASAQSNATDTTFFPMHQGNRWVYEMIEFTNPVLLSYTIFEIRNPVIQRDSVLSTRYDTRLPPFLRRAPLLCGEDYDCYEDSWLDYQVSNGRFYARLGDVSMKILDLGLADSDSLVVLNTFDPTWRMVQKVTERGIVDRDGQSVDFLSVTVEIYSDDFFQPYNLQVYSFERGLGETKGYSCNFECYSSFYPFLIAARINGQVLFGDITVSNEDDRAGTPEAFRLDAAYPNPFNPSTTLNFALDRSGEASLEVYDMLGRRVLAEELGTLHAGEHRHTLDMTRRSSGTYLVRLQAGGQVRTTTVTLVK